MLATALFNLAMMSAAFPATTATHRAPTDHRQNPHTPTDTKFYRNPKHAQPRIENANDRKKYTFEEAKAYAKRLQNPYAILSIEIFAEPQTAFDSHAAKPCLSKNIEDPYATHAVLDEAAMMRNLRPQCDRNLCDID